MAARLVVGAALLRDGLVLAARRARPRTGAGRWELPGGKVEPGEPPAAAVVRELREELGVAVEVTGWLAGRVPVPGSDLVLVVATAVVLSGEPEAREHDRLLWVGAEDLEDLDWLEPDRPFLPALARVLTAGGAGDDWSDARRAVLLDRDDAVAVAERLARDGHRARVVRAPSAGEDDDEDQPWAVLSDAPAGLLGLLADERDGWLDEDEPTGGPRSTGGPSLLPPLPPLPTRPRRTRADRGDPGGAP